VSRLATLATEIPERATRPARGIQLRVVTTAVLLLVGGAAWIARDYGLRHAALLPVGAALGLVLYHAAFGFTAAFRAFVTLGDGRGIRAQMLMLALATLLFAPVLAQGAVFGRDVVGALAPAGLSVLIGAFVFAIGMQLGGGCGSGTLFHLGSGTTSMGLVLLAFVAGSVVATFHMPFWSALPSLGEVALGESLGWPAAVAAQLAAFAAIAAITRVIEHRRLGPASTPARETGWSWLVRGPWPLLAGAVLLAVLNFATLGLAGHPWTITWAFTLWGGKTLQALGYDLATVPFWQGEFQQAALASPVLADTTSVLDLGLVLGALLGAGLAGRFAPRRLGPRRVVAALLGGLLLGYGARLAFGCNIGAYVGGIASTSLHGWLWGVAALLGTPVGVRLRALLDPMPESSRAS
jgi:uncharacterized membrane protein YedE/YeeE